MRNGGPLKLLVNGEITKDTLKNTAADKVSGATELDKPDGILDNEKMNKIWDWLVPKLTEAGLAAHMDSLTVEMAVRHYVHAVDASDQLLAGDLLVHGRDEHKKNPLEAVFRSESASFLSYARVLGLSFASRVRMPEPSATADDTPNPYGEAQAR